MFSNWFSSFYRVFLVFLVITGLELYMSEVRSSGAKNSERTRIEDFHERNNLAGCSRACGASECMIPHERFLWKLIIF